MKYRRLGSSGLRVSEVSLGSWLTLGTGEDPAAARARIRRAYELGVNLFDTADVYHRGRAELVLGEALEGLPRRALVIASKCFFPMSDDPNDRGLSRKHVFESVEGSLRRLKTEYLDLHQCHRSDPDTPLEETVRAYDDLIRQGKLLYWGVSEWPPERILEVARLARESGAHAPISNQPEYSLLRRNAERHVLPACAEVGIGQIVFSPLAQGILTGKYSSGARPAGSRAVDPESGRWMQDGLNDAVTNRVDELRPIAAELGLTLAQLALAWCLRISRISSVIVGATRTEQVEENVGASGVALSEEILARIEAIFPRPGIVQRALRRFKR